LSDGFHSLREKTGMVVTHLFGEKRNEDIHLSESQVLALSERCAACHRAEHAGWLSGGHAVNYREIFMDSIHNAQEKPYWDCLRCHGMFYDGDIHDLMTLDGDAREWTIRDRHQETLPTIPCLACHQIHTDNPVSQRYVAHADSSRNRIVPNAAKPLYVAHSDSSYHEIARNPVTALYVRADKIYLRSDKLTKVPMTSADGKLLKSASDPNTLLCQQCHAPDYRHRAGSQDDRTPDDVHTGISCIACHNPHSGTTQESCAKCHE
jgi:hypothetical protein